MWKFLFLVISERYRTQNELRKYCGEISSEIKRKKKKLYKQQKRHVLTFSFQMSVLQHRKYENENLYLENLDIREERIIKILGRTLSKKKKKAYSFNNLLKILIFYF